ncbi:MAG: xanthine dehydrogenase family protein molybdopterin-binding subunit [Thermodesulfobacteriota bacterium]
MVDYKIIGKPLIKVDAVDKVTGQAQFINDLRFPGMLYGKVKRSTAAHARILSVDTSLAQKVPGVRAVVTGKEFAGRFSNPLCGNPMKDQPFLAVDRVRFAGEAVAGVAATSEEAAEEAVDLIKVEFEELPPVLSIDTALSVNAPIIHENLMDYQRSANMNPQAGSNICDRTLIESGDIEKGFQEADYIFEDTFTTQIVQHCAMEPRAAVAQFHHNGGVTIWTSDQAPYGARSNVADALKIPPSKVRIVVPPYVGGGFGTKIRMTGLIACVPLAWKANYRPVKFLLTRQEEFTSTTTRHGAQITLKTGVKKDGTIIARHAVLIYENGAYCDRGATVLGKGRYAVIGPYKIPHVRVDGQLIYTNKPPGGAYRGYGIPQVCWAHDSQMDIIARKLGMDPFEIRLKNIVDEGYVSGTEKTAHHAVGLGECLRQVRRNMNAGKAAASQGKNLKTGSGIACGYKISRTPSGADAFVKLSPDGGADILVSSTEMGQGINTVLSQIVAEELSIDIRNIRVLPPDTYTTPMFPASTSSRTTFFMGNAVKEAALEIRSQLFSLGEKIFKTDRSHLVLENGTIADRKNPESRISLKEFIQMTYAGGANIMGRGNYCHYWPGKVPGHVKLEIEPSLCWQYAAHGVQVAVDTDTGKVSVLKVFAAHDVGRALNPANCEGQIQGGFVQAMGGCTIEEMRFGAGGRLMNPSFSDYKIPGSPDIPEIRAILVEEPHREGPYGAKGLGEISLVPVAPAIANAIFDAVGVRIKELPITPEKILKGMREGK